MNISIFGLGYVGTVSAGCLASDGHNVVGVDVNPAKVDTLNSGIAPIVEPRLSELIAGGKEAGLLSATTSSREAVCRTDISIVCVGTPSQPNGDLDLTYMRRVAQDIGEVLRDKKTYHLVVFRSTMLPGTTEDVLLPILESASGKQAGTTFDVCYHPEFLREGTSVHDFYHPPKIVLGERTAGAADPVASLYDGFDAPMIRSTIRVAEMAKYCDNAFHALKVSFANEVGNLCKKMGVDSHDVMSVFCQDTKLNLSPAYLKPGFSFGGSCLPKDVRALTYKAKRFDLESPVLNSILASNTAQTRMGVQRIIDTGKRRVGFLGMAFKPDTDDLRESPLVEVIETLIGKGYAIRIYDRNVSLSRLIGANRRFIEEHIPHLSSLLVEDAMDLVEHSDVIVVGYSAPEFRPVLEALGAHQTVIDLARIDKSPKTAAAYDGIAW
jgi:GDP-mannose 6-dehydrogenase